MSPNDPHEPSDTAAAPANERERLELAHHHPGRLRVRADALCVEGELIDRVKRALEALPGITAVVHTVRSGSFLIEYEPGHAEPDAIIAMVAEAADLDLPLDEEELRRRRATPAIVAIRAAQELNAIAHEVTGGRADLRSVVPAALAGVAVYSFLFNKKEARLPRWDNLLYWSYNVFSALHSREIGASSRERATPR